MTIRRFVIFIALLATVLLPALAVHAQVSQETLVSERCSSIKIALDQQRRRDLVTRVNRGRAYQSLIDQLQALTNRVRNNQMSTQPFEQQQTILKQEFDAFRAAYSAYDDSLRTLVNTDCTAKPADFLAQLAQARQFRAQVGNHEKIIADTLTRYREIIVNLQLELQRLREAVLGEQQ